MEFMPSASDNSPGGAVNRPIRVTVRTVGGRHADVEQNVVSAYHDAISIVNMNRCCRRYGVPLPRSCCTHLWMVRDCAGWVGAGFTWFLIAGGELLVMLALVSRPFTIFALLNGLLSLSCATLGVIAHFKSMFTDPGAVPKGDATQATIARMGLKDGDVVYRCPKCDCIKPERAHHCSVCRRCIRKMDHHCPWINNCVGENNQKFFVLFTLYICIISWHGLALGIFSLVRCTVNNFRECDQSPTFILVVTLLLVLEGLMFGLFTAIMCGSQLSAICSDETGIEHLKKEAGRWKKRTCWMNLQDVFGGQFSYVWFSPFHATAVSEDVGPPEICVYSTL